MVVFAKQVSAADPRFKNRSIQMGTIGPQLQATVDTVIPVEDTEVICNGCNKNIYHDDHETPGDWGHGWLIYFDKETLEEDRPYDIYCDECLERSFSDHIKVT